MNVVCLHRELLAGLRHPLRWSHSTGTFDRSSRLAIQIGQLDSERGIYVWAECDEMSGKVN